MTEFSLPADALRRTDVSVGNRVVLPDGAECYPIFFYTERLTGTVVRVEDDCVWIKLDKLKAELREWDNEVQIWSDGNELLTTYMVRETLSTNDGTLDAFVLAECKAAGKECDGDLFGVLFSGRETFTTDEARTIVQGALTMPEA